jgi:hypothetical protein
MSEFHDPELRQQLGRLSGPYPDDNVAYAAFQRRLGQARRRRAVAWTTGAALSLVIATVALAAVQSPGSRGVVPGKSSETSATVSSTVATTEAEAEESSTTESTVAETMAPAVVVSETPPSSEAVESSTPEAEPTQGATGTQPSGSKKSGGPPTTPAPAAVPQPTTKTIDSLGGSITVRQDGDRLEIVGFNAAGGFDAHETDHSGRRVGMIFTSSKHRSVIIVRVSDGVIKSVVSEQDSHEETFPWDTSGGGHGDSDNG